MGHRDLRYRPPIINNTFFPIEFQEHLYPPLVNSEEYYQRIELGKKRCKKINLGIIGCARDIQNVIDRTIYNVEKIGSVFKDYNIGIFESDSKDSTLELLYSWAQKNNKLTVLTEKLNLPRLGDLSQRRFEVMAVIRNKILDFAKENLSWCDYICVLDLDFRGSTSINGVLNSFGYCELWDVITANGLDGAENYYYDMAILMLNGFAHEDVMVEMRPGAKYANIKRGFERPRFNRGEPLYKVASAFGGMAFYRTDALLSAKYETFLCDHASLHTRLFQNGYRRLFINPSMVLIR